MHNPLSPMAQKGRQGNDGFNYLAHAAHPTLNRHTLLVGISWRDK
jgi:hypothetical protein